MKKIETWLSKERLLSNSTPRFLTDDEEELREQPSSVRQCSRLLLLCFFRSVINRDGSRFSNIRIFYLVIEYRLGCAIIF